MNAAGRVGRYEIRRVIGRGGMATVYLAHQSDLDRDVALKELRLGDGPPEPGVAQRFLREARLASSLVHPAIVTVHDYFEADQTPYIAMEYLPRGALRAHVGRLTLAQIGGVVQAVLGGLAFAAERGIVHRDLKPENIMITEQGRAKLADFGIAKATSAATANLTTAGTTLGTPRYMAPERALGQDVGPASDLYSVGVVAFELLAGHTPFHDTVEPMAVLMRQINDPVPPVVSLVPDVGEPLSGWIERLLVKAPEQRTASAAVAWDELEEILLDQLGPRWWRAAALPEHPAGVTQPVPVAAPARADNTRRAPSRRAAASSLATSTDVRAPMDDAPTLAPVAVRGAGRRRRRRVGHVRLLAVAVVVAGIALASGRVLGGHSPAPPTSVRDVTSRAADRRSQLTSARTGRGRAGAADALAKDYDGAAVKAAGAAVARRLRRAGDAYRRAADAARREDGSDYDDALADARAAERRLSGAGDSRSDDASDDEPDENDNGD